MKELIARMLAMPRTAVELAVASVFINTLALASPLFVMQVLNRYVSQGVDSTLVTLVTGTLLAIGLELAFRQARSQLARSVSIKPDEFIALGSYEILTKARPSALNRIPAETRSELVSGAAAIESAYSSTNIETILDVPFSLLFVAVLYFLSPLIALIVMAFLITVFVGGVLGGLSLRKKTEELQQGSREGSALMGTAIREGDTVRAFNAGDFLRSAWKAHQGFIQRKRRDIAARQGTVQTLTQSATVIMSVAVVGTGATLVVLGELDVGAMIGANILGARALQPISKFSQLGAAFAKARQALQLFKELVKVPLESDSGSALSDYKGGVEFRDLAFAYPGSPVPIFESLSLNLEPGTILVVTGANGTGKTTLARMLLGLLEPIRGQFLVDGLDLNQVAPEWWRKQVIYQPQEPALLNATIGENLQIGNPDIDKKNISQIIDMVGLRRFLDESPQGLDTVVVDNGWRLSEGIRRRMALARALATNGKLAIIDEPTESLDADGCAAVHDILGRLAQKGCTIILMSHDKNIVKGPHVLLDLNVKPIPEVIRMSDKVTTVKDGKK